jgi:DNA polymerase III delta prime subunit
MLFTYTMTIEMHKNIYEQLNGYYKNNQIPNIIFHGASGTGKKRIVTDFIDKIYNNDRNIIKHNVMFVNCSHGKGIKFIREDLKFFAKANLETKIHINFKTIVLLNADFLTNDAQSALRRCIEQFSYTTRFFMIVENKHKLLNPILSRFCEIHIPEYYVNNKFINLHQLTLDKMANTDILVKQKESFINETIEQIKLDKCNNRLTNAEVLRFCENIYENGYSSLDIVNSIKSDNTITHLKRTSIEVYYSKIKSELRSEKLLLFSILNYIFNREIEDISKIKFI